MHAHKCKFDIIYNFPFYDQSGENQGSVKIETGISDDAYKFYINHSIFVVINNHWWSST
jgi:hypothetical protein